MDKQQDCLVVLQTGFRIFFLGAAAYAIISMALWLVLYALHGNASVAMPPAIWHGHEMIFGFTLAVIAGFLLTAVTNWTGLPTLSGTPLLILFLLWILARLCAFMPMSFSLWPLALCNIAFLVFLSVAIIRPIAQVKQWKQSAVFSKLILILLGAIVFYVALFNSNFAMGRKALFFVVYMIIGLIMTISRRVLPFFIERGVGYPVTLRNNSLLDQLSLGLLFAFSFIDVCLNWPIVVAVISGLLVIVHSLRLYGWYTPGIWKKPLLWILFMGYAFVICGFFLKTLALQGFQFEDSALHAFTAGGIGIFTLGMMARVSWGHTGRNINAAPAGLPLIFIPIVVCAFIRIFFPLLEGSKYVLWIGISQVFWIMAFAFYLILFFGVLTSPRPDKKWG